MAGFYLWRRPPIPLLAIEKCCGSSERQTHESGAAIVEKDGRARLQRQDRASEGHEILTACSKDAVCIV